MILRNTAQGRNARSEPLFVDGMSRITKTKKYCRVLMIMRLSLTPASWVGVKADEFVEAGVEPRGVGFQGGVGEPFSPSPDPAGAAEQMPKLGRKDVVAGVDGILHVADEMGEAGGFEPSHGGIPGLQALSSESFSAALTRRKVDCMTGANRTLRLGWPLLFLTQMGLIIWRRLRPLSDGLGAYRSARR